MATRDPLPRLLSPREVQDETGIPRKTTYDLVARGELPAVRIGRSVRVDEDDLRRFIEARRERGAA